MARRSIARLAVLALVGSGCGFNARGGGESATYYRVRVDSLGATPAVVRLRSIVRRHGRGARKAGFRPPARPVGKVDSLVWKAVRDRPGRRDTVLVTFRDPLLRQFVPGAGRRDSARVGLLTHGHGPGAGLAAGLAGARDSSYDRLVAELARDYRAREIRRYWLIQALLLEMPLDSAAVASLARRPDVLSIEPLRGGPPPQVRMGPCGTTGETAAYASAMLGIERLRAAGLARGRIGLIDTGVLPTHTLLAQSGRLRRFLDCTDPSKDRCEETSTQADAHPPGHGTASAALLVGDDPADERHRGLTDALLDSYRVYVTSGTTSAVTTDAAVKAFEDAVEQGFEVIVAEVALSPVGALAQQVLRAYGRGTLVVAANGNESGIVSGPASSPLAVGTGAYCVHTNRFVKELAHGRTADGRIKPDITAPSSVYTAGRTGSGAMTSTDMSSYNATSGATPFAAAAALSLLGGVGTAPDPGAALAMMVLCGEKGKVDPEEGAGPVRLPADGVLRWGKEGLSNGDTVTIQLDVEEPAAGMEVAIWWPEFGQGDGGLPSFEERADIDLEVVSPSGARGASADWGSAFERVSIPADPPVSGTWTLRLIGFWVPGEPRQVYWAAWARPALLVP